MKLSSIPAVKVREGVERREVHTDTLMMVIIDFDDGPKPQPDPPNSHPHEQISYVVEGEVNFLMDAKLSHLGPGEVFLIPSGKPHSIQQLTSHARLIDCFTPLREDFLVSRE